MSDFPRIDRLPPYVFAEVNDLKMKARRRGEDIIDLGMGNPDQPTPQHIVDKLIEAAAKGRNNRYSVSRGIPNLRRAIAEHYEEHYGVQIDAETEAIATMGAKEGLFHLILAGTGPGDAVLVPTPNYPIHSYAAVIAGAELLTVPLLGGEDDFFDRLRSAFERHWPRPKFMILSFPNNPTTQVVDLDFFERVVRFATDQKTWVIHDFAYADLAFDSFQPPSFLQVPGAKKVGVEFYSLSKSFNMPGWRVAFCLGNKDLVGVLGRLKSYIDYGIYQPVQIAATVALRGPKECMTEINELYRHRRDVLIQGLARAGWAVEPPRATMFVWAPIPPQYKALGSVEFAKLLLREAKVAVSPGVGFGPDGEGFVRFALVENDQRTRQAMRSIRAMFQGTGAAESDTPMAAEVHA